MAQGTIGKLETFEDMLAVGQETWIAGVGRLGNLAYTSVNEGSFALVTDEDGGVVTVTTDTADNDNWFGFAGKFLPANGQCVLETRFKYGNLDCAIFAGFTETLALDTPVMPAEFATATMTYNGSGQMVGIQYDVDGTTDDWRAVFADAGAVLSGADANGTRANDTPTVDEYVVVRVEVGANGIARVMFGHDSNNLKIVKEVTGVPVSNGMYATLGIENRSGNARTLEIDYFYACGHRDWTE